MKLFYITIVLFLFTACNNSNGSEENYETESGASLRSSQSDETNDDDGEYSDGTWCADVEYYNPNTGTRHTYNLDVEVENDELVQINWPNGGWLDESHFVAEDISSGECSFTSDEGYRYTITLNEKGSCGYSDSYR